LLIWVCVQLGQAQNGVSNEQNIRWNLPATLQKAQRTPLSATSFFIKDTAVIYGRIENYNMQEGIRDVKLDVTNALLKESQPLFCEIKPDGSFEIRAPLNHPYLCALQLGNSIIEVYLEPGQPIGIQLNMQEMVKNGAFEKVSFYGSLASINRGLQAVPRRGFKGYEYRDWSVRNTTPKDFSNIQDKELKIYLERLSQTPILGDVTPEVLEIRKMQALVSDAENRFEYLMIHPLAKDAPSSVMQAPVESDYFNFLGALPLDDPKLLIPSNFHRFMVGFESMFNQAYMPKLGNKIQDVSLGDHITMAVYDSDRKNSVSFSDYLEKGGFKLTKADQKALRMYDAEKVSSDTAELMVLDQRYDALMEKFKPQYREYEERIAKKEFELSNWKERDATLFRTLGVKPNLVTDIAKLRSLKGGLMPLSSTAASELFPEFERRTNNAYLKEESKRYYQQHYASGRAIALPEGSATNGFLKLVDAYRGQYVLVSFWSPLCVFSVNSMELMDEKMRKYFNHPGIEFVFITSSDWTSLKAYKDYLKKHPLKHSHYIDATDFHTYQQLFGFTGVPYFVLLDKQGRVLQKMGALYFLDFEGLLKTP